MCADKSRRKTSLPAPNISVATSWCRGEGNTIVGVLQIIGSAGGVAGPEQAQEFHVRKLGGKNSKENGGNHLGIDLLLRLGGVSRYDF